MSGALLSVLMWSLATVSVEPPEEPAVQDCERGEQQMRGLEFSPAVASFERATSSARRLNVVVRSYAGLAQAAAAAGLSDKARDAFKVLLAISPQWRLPPGASPRVKEPYEVARAFWAERGGFELLLTVPAAVHANENVNVQARLKGDPLKLIARVDVRWRLGGEVTRAQTVSDGARAIVIPADEVPSTGLEVWAVALSEKGAEFLVTERRRVEVKAPASAPTVPVVVEKTQEPSLLRMAALGFYNPLARRLGVEAQLSLRLGTIADVLAGAIIGQNPGIRAGVTLHPPRLPGRRFSWLVQPRIGVYPLPEGIAFGGGAGAGGTVEAWRGRALAMAGFEFYRAPTGYSPYELMLSLGYEVDF